MLLALDDSGPLHRQLYGRLRSEILSGRLQPRSRLPSTRDLAAEAGVSRTTAVLAYDQLLGEGYATARRGSGTYVAAELPVNGSVLAHRSERRRPRPSPRLSRYGRRNNPKPGAALPSWGSARPPLAVDFRYGRPSYGDFPHAPWRRAIGRRLRAASVRALDYGPPEGLAPLREAIADYLRRSRAVACVADQILIVNGSQQGLDLIARVLLDPGDRVLLEEPQYVGARRAFLAAGAELVTAAVGPEGLDVASLPRRAARARLAYVTPSHQFPTGVIMSAPRRLALLAWARKNHAMVVEDDYDGDYRYAGRPIESLQGLDRTGRVIYLGTFSKVMFPALRLGYLVLPEPLVRPFRAAKALADTGSPTLEQAALAEFMREGHFERHLHRTRRRNAARRRALLGAITEHLGDRVEVSGAEAGLHVLVWLRTVARRELPRLLRRAEAAGVGIYPVTPHYQRPPERAGLLLGYAALTEREIRRGIETLAGLV
jgi:GntR family transcriptional regulator / MocR family aminotransferase